MKVLEVGSLKIGDGIPKICVPIVGKTKVEICDEIKKIKDLNIDLVEWRVDYYEDVKNINKTKETLKYIKNELKEIPIIFTFRSKIEGGNQEVSIEYYVKLNKEIANSNLVDLIDIELFLGYDIVIDLVNYAHAKGIKVIISNHDFNKTPSKEEIIARLCEMQSLECDLAKIAVMPQCEDDVLILLEATNEMKKKHNKTPIVTMSMGSLGIVSRICGNTFGSAITFGCVNKASAPGQIQVDDLRKILAILNENN